MFDELKIVNEKGKPVSKSVYLYFPAWKDKSGDMLEIMPCVYEFFKELKPSSKTLNRIEKKDDKYYIYSEHNNAILINLE